MFLSSNIREYLTEGKVLKADIVSELAPLAMSYATNMAAAKHALGYSRGGRCQRKCTGAASTPTHIHGRGSRDSIPLQNKEEGGDQTPQFCPTRPKRP